MIRQLLPFVRSELESILENRIIRITTYSSLILCIFTICIPLFSWRILPPYIPLWFSKPWGLERLASVYWLFLPPISSLFWLITTLTISIKLLKDHLVFAQIMTFVTLLVSIMSFITVTTVISLVI